MGGESCTVLRLRLMRKLAMSLKSFVQELSAAKILQSKNKGHLVLLKLGA